MFSFRPRHELAGNLAATANWNVSRIATAMCRWDKISKPRSNEVEWWRERETWCNLRLYSHWRQQRRGDYCNEGYRGEGCVQGGHTASLRDKMAEERKSQCGKEKKALRAVEFAGVPTSTLSLYLNVLPTFASQTPVLTYDLHGVVSQYQRLR